MVYRANARLLRMTVIAAIGTPRIAASTPPCSSMRRARSSGDHAFARTVRSCFPEPLAYDFTWLREVPRLGDNGVAEGTSVSCPTLLRPKCSAHSGRKLTNPALCRDVGFWPSFPFTPTARMSALGFIRQPSIVDGRQRVMAITHP